MPFVVLTSEGVVRVRKRRALEAVVDAALARTEPWMPSPMAARWKPNRLQPARVAATSSSGTMQRFKLQDVSHGTERQHF